MKLEEVMLDLQKLPLQVLNSLVEYFGEDKVDMQPIVDQNTIISLYDPQKAEDDYDIQDVYYKLRDYTYAEILIYFPSIKVTNEEGNSIDIQDVYIKVQISYLGTIKGTFTINRSTYSIDQFRSGYTHSHTPRRDVEDYYYFSSMCLGNGPINNTIVSLSIEYNADLWLLFCMELTKYLQTESLKGGPYFTLSTINKSATYIDIVQVKSEAIRLESDFLLGFMRYFLNKNILKYNYIDGRFSIAMSFTEYWLLISNHFIEYYNSYEDDVTKPALKGVYAMLLYPYIIDNDKVYFEQGANYVSEIYNLHNNKLLFYFKDEEVKLTLTDVPTEIRTTRLLQIDTAAVLLINILQIINLNYGKDKTNKNTYFL